MPAHARADRTIREFEDHELASRILERCKELAREQRDGPSRLFIKCISANAEEDLDDAWDDVGLVSEELSDECAGLIAAHFLFLTPWSDVAAEKEISEWQAKWRAYEALGWLERMKYGEGNQVRGGGGGDGTQAGH